MYRMFADDVTQANAEAAAAYDTWRKAVQEVADAVNRQRMAGESLHDVDSPPPAPAAIPDVRNAMEQRAADATATAQGGAAQNGKKRRILQGTSVFPSANHAVSDLLFKAGMERNLKLSRTVVTTEQAGRGNMTDGGLNPNGRKGPY